MSDINNDFNNVHMRYQLTLLSPHSSNMNGKYMLTTKAKPYSNDVILRHFQITYHLLIISIPA